MYAVIRIGASQERVSVGQSVRIDLRKEAEGSEISFEPVLVVDGDKVLAGPALKGAIEKGKKINGLTYKAKAIQRRHWGHRQKYSTVEITKISTK